MVNINADLSTLVFLHCMQCKNTKVDKSALYAHCPASKGAPRLQVRKCVRLLLGYVHISVSFLLVCSTFTFLFVLVRNPTLTEDKSTNQFAWSTGLHSMQRFGKCAHRVIYEPLWPTVTHNILLSIHLQIHFHKLLVKNWPFRGGAMVWDCSNLKPFFNQ